MWPRVKAEPEAAYVARDRFTCFDRIWRCDPPPNRAIEFRVLKCEWSEDLRVQTIYEWEPVN